MYVTAIVLAAGKGRRFRSKVPKPLTQIESKPIINYSLLRFNKHPDIKDIVVVVNTSNRQGIINKIRQEHLDKVRKVVKGGRRRQDSVANGLNAIDGKTDLVLIHDGARPFIRRQTITAVIKKAKECGAAIVGVPVKATIKSVSRNNIIIRTLNRDQLWEIQTPQVFKKNLILEAFEKFGKQDVTDDAMLVEKLGARVKIVLGFYDNIKITTPEDLLIAKSIIRGKN